MCRTLLAAEIDCRVQKIIKTESGGACSLLLYKDARCDMAIMDETFGSLNWQRRHEFKDGKNYCTVSVYNTELGEWVAKEDVGTPSNTEENKGEASDAFKRACVNFGIGRELYSAPTIWVTLAAAELVERGGKYSLKPSVSFRVSKIEYNDAREIIELVIVDKKNAVRFDMHPKSASTSKVEQVPTPDKKVAQTQDKAARKYDAEPEDGTQSDLELSMAKEAVQKCNTIDELHAVWDGSKYYHNTLSFITAVNNRKGAINNIINH